VTSSEGAVILEGMTDKARALLEQAKKLSDDERESLAYEILQTVGKQDEFLSPEWCEEIDRRIARVASGKAKGMTGKEAITSVRRALKERREARGKTSSR
jgi:hypothetical protein